jgi:SOS response regulatory protein OraA/RecX
MAYSIQFEEKEFRKELLKLGLDEERVNEIIQTFDKNHKHLSAVNFILILTRYGIPKEKIENFLKMNGIDDATVLRLFIEVDETKAQVGSGRVYEIELE